MNELTDDSPAAVDPHALQYQEILFSLVMSVVAIIGRDNPLVRYPDILWAFAAMLVFNLLYYRFLRLGRGARVALVSMAVNTALISGVVGLSGGADSSFWPLYLLPVFTACLHLARRHVIGVCVAVGGFLACFYIESFWQFRLWQACEFVIKLGVLALAAAVTAHLSFRERAQRSALADARARFEALARALERRTAADLRVLNKRSLDASLPEIAHALNNPLAIILGSLELLMKEEQAGSPRLEDYERIHAAATRCARVGEELLAYGRQEQGAP